MYYYAINVKKGSEVSVAKKIYTINEILNKCLVHKVLVPFQSKITIDISKKQANHRQILLFNSYIFIAIEDEITNEIYNEIKKISSVYKILIDPIQENEMNFLASGDVTEFIVDLPKTSTLEKLQTLFKNVIQNKKTKSISFLVKNNRYLQFNLPKNIIEKIEKKINLTLQNITNQPILFIKEVLNNL